jgi:hypothetical protein
MKVEYSSNNSGGHWWLKDDDWYALEKAGWKVKWKKDEKDSLFGCDKDGRWLGALATRAEREGLHLREAVEEWERVTGQISTEAGCPCCGQPHYFTEYDDKDEFVTSGPSIRYEASW